MNLRLTLIGLLGLALCTQVSRAETPTEAVDRVWNAFGPYDPAQHHYDVPPSFVELSKQVAREQGVAVVAPIMARSNAWKSNEEIVFSSLLEALPLEQVTPILEGYQKSGTKSEKHYAEIILMQCRARQAVLKLYSDAKKKKAETGTSP